MLVLWESKTKRVMLVFNSEAREFEIWHWDHKTWAELATDKSEEFPEKISSVIAREIAQAEKVLQSYKNLYYDYPVKYYERLTKAARQCMGKT